MELVVRKFASHEEQDEADRQYYQSLTPAQRLDILLDLINTHDTGLDPAETRFRLVWLIRDMKTGRIIRSGGSPKQFRRPSAQE